MLQHVVLFGSAFSAAWFESIGTIGKEIVGDVLQRESDQSQGIGQ